MHRTKKLLILTVIACLGLPAYPVRIASLWNTFKRSHKAQCMVLGLFIVWKGWRIVNQIVPQDCDISNTKSPHAKDCHSICTNAREGDAISPLMLPQAHTAPSMPRHNQHPTPPTSAITILNFMRYINCYR